jgi:hypothetical protein
VVNAAVVGVSCRGVVVVVATARGVSTAVVVVVAASAVVDVVVVGGSGISDVVVVAPTTVVVVVGVTAVVVVVGGVTTVVVVVGGVTTVVVVVGATAVVVVVGATAVVVVVGATPVVDVVGATPVVVVGGAAAHTGVVTRFESNVVAPLRARSRPATVALVVAVMEVRASTLPTKVVRTPSVAELPTCQNTLQACAPLTSTTLLSVAVTTVDPAWKMNAAVGSPCASSVSVPVSPKEVGDEYVPETSVMPPRSVGTAKATNGARLAASS